MIRVAVSPAIRSSVFPGDQRKPFKDCRSGKEHNENPYIPGIAYPKRKADYNCGRDDEQHDTDPDVEPEEGKDEERDSYIQA
jgi:hypothetical protein